MNGHDSLIDIFNMEAARVAELDAKHLQEFHQRIDVKGIEFYEIGHRGKRNGTRPANEPELYDQSLRLLERADAIDKDLQNLTKRINESNATKIRTTESIDARCE